ncbi:hypothetical protein ACTXT7_011500 [Hymenolepis weldensis]
MAKFQHGVALLRGRLVVQVKDRTRLKAVFNVLSETNPPRSKVATTNSPVTLSMSINPFILGLFDNTTGAFNGRRFSHID